MMTNQDVANFAGTNQELCELMGKFASPDSPAHFYNFTAKSLRDRAKIAVAEARGGEVFELKSRRSKYTAPANQSPANTDIVQLPQSLAALLPALHLMLQAKGHNLDCGLKQWVLQESTPANTDNGGDAILPEEVSEFLGMFGMDDSENERLLLSYAGVKTLRTIRIERIKEAIKALSAIKLESLSYDRIDDLERALLSFALTGDSDADE